MKKNQKQGWRVSKWGRSLALQADNLDLIQTPHILPVFHQEWFLSAILGQTGVRRKEIVSTADGTVSNSTALKQEFSKLNKLNFHLTQRFSSKNKSDRIYFVLH